MKGLKYEFLETAVNVCSECEDENEWDKQVRAQMKIEFPEEDPDKGRPGDHPFWKRWKELWSAYSVKCITFTYDDLAYSLCEDHYSRVTRAFEDFQS